MAILLAFSLGLSYPAYSASGDDLELLDTSDANFLKENTDVSASTEKELPSPIEEKDDLEALKQDIGENLFPEDKASAKTVEKKEEKFKVIEENPSAKEVVKINELSGKETAEIKEQSESKGFDASKEEKKLLEVAKLFQTKIPEKEWKEIASRSQKDKYVVQKGDMLWNIARKLFGSGFYYSKVWALNPHITNPHEIVPGMTLVFDTGSEDALPNVVVGEFETIDLGGKASADGSSKSKQVFDFEEFGDFSRPSWLDERKKLMEQGSYFQYASEETYDDLAEIGRKSLTKEYEKYEPPETSISIRPPDQQYDDAGFDKSSKISFRFKEGFFLNSFVTTNIVQDFGSIEAKQNESIFVKKHESIYVNFDPSVKVRPGDKFSVYAAEGKITHKISDRTGYRYTVLAQIQAERKVNNLWECLVIDQTGIPSRGDRITIYTPKIEKITKTFNQRNIEAAIIGSYGQNNNGLAFGDVVYLDRGRADGLELGNVLESYSFIDRGTEKRITPDPTYKIGEITIISLTDNFATGLIINSSSEMTTGTIALTKTAEAAAKSSKIKNLDALKDTKKIESKALEELDVELNLDDVSKDILEKADSVSLTEDELEELERQEKEKSVIKDHEKDLKELDKIEKDIVDAEKNLNEGKLDEDKLLEQNDLNDVEKNSKDPKADAFESLDEIESDIGRKYLDEDLNSKENPYGLTEIDLEEIDELLNTDTAKPAPKSKKQ